MKNNSILAALVLVLGLSAVASAVQVIRYRSQFNANLAAARQLQATAENLNRVRSVIQSLANDSVEYSKTHPAIDPILQQFNLKPATAAKATSTRAK